MDLNSWTPDDNARRFATLIATAAGVFTFMALWLGLNVHPLLALLAGALLGALLWSALRPLLRAYFRR